MLGVSNVLVDPRPTAASDFADPQTLVGAEDAASNKRCTAVYVWHFAGQVTDKQLPLLMGQMNDLEAFPGG